MTQFGRLMVHGDSQVTWTYAPADAATTSTVYGVEYDPILEAVRDEFANEKVASKRQINESVALRRKQRQQSYSDHKRARARFR